MAEGFRGYTVALFLCYILALISTAIRLWHRKRRGQLSWDDFWAVVAAFNAFILMIVLCVTTNIDLQDMTPRNASFIKWVPYPTNTTAIWATRLSIGCTVVRILPPGRAKWITKAANIVFVFLWGANMIQKLLICGVPLPAIPECPFARAVPVLGITTNFIGSIWLVIWPAYILLSVRIRLIRLTGMRLPSTHHRILLACFSTSILLLAANIGHAVYFFKVDPYLLRITGHIEVSLSVFLCNILILATSIYRAIVDPDNKTQLSKSSHSESGNVALSNLRSGLARGRATSVGEANLEQKLAITRETTTYTVVSGPDGLVIGNPGRHAIVKDTSSNSADKEDLSEFVNGGDHTLYPPKKDSSV